MFGRSKTSTATAPATAATAEADLRQSAADSRSGGKGRPTPSRREAEQRNRRSLIGAETVRPDATKAERKAARQAQQAVYRQERALQRQALVTGDERYLPARDRGPARRWVRDYVDARRNVGEWLIPVLVVDMALGMIPSLPVVLAAQILLYGSMIATAVDSFLLQRKLNREIGSRFPSSTPGAAGVGRYGIMRALQLRFLRMPKPQVARGAYPR